MGCYHVVIGGDNGDGLFFAILNIYNSILSQPIEKGNEIMRKIHLLRTFGAHCKEMLIIVHSCAMI